MLTFGFITAIIWMIVGAILFFISLGEDKPFVHGMGVGLFIIGLCVLSFCFGVYIR